MLQQNLSSEASHRQKSKHLDLNLEGSETLSITFFVFVKFMLKGFSPQVLVLIPYIFVKSLPSDKKTHYILGTKKPQHFC